MKNMVEVYCLVDNLVKLISMKMKKSPAGRPGNLSTTDYVVLAIMKQQMGFQTTKQFYENAKHAYASEFPLFPSYQQFNHGIKSTFKFFIIISWVLMQRVRSRKSKYHFIDSTPIPVCSNQYRFAAKLFKGLASAGKNAFGWYWGFKLHLIINENMEIESLRITDGSSSDISVLDGKFIAYITGILVGDKGYISKEKSAELALKNLTLITKPRKNMRKLPATKEFNYLLSQRQAIESVFSTLKYRLNAVNTFARSAEGFFVSVFSAVTAYSINLLTKNDLMKDTFLISVIS